MALHGQTERPFLSPHHRPMALCEVAVLVDVPLRGLPNKQPSQGHVFLSSRRLLLPVPRLPLDIQASLVGPTLFSLPSATPGTLTLRHPQHLLRSRRRSPCHGHGGPRPQACTSRGMTSLQGAGTCSPQGLTGPQVKGMLTKEAVI